MDEENFCDRYFLFFFYRQQPVYSKKNRGFFLRERIFYPAFYYTYQLAKKHEVNIRAVYAVKMPENFTLTFSTPQLYNRMILKSAEKKTERLIDSIKSKQEHLPSKKKTNEAAYEKNKANWHLLAEDFSVKDNCTKCKKCIRLCPVDNIAIVEDKIRFSDKCVADQQYLQIIKQRRRFGVFSGASAVAGQKMKTATSSLPILHAI